MATEHGFAMWLAMAIGLRGGALVGEGQLHAGIRDLRCALEDLPKLGLNILDPVNLTALAMALGASGQVDEGLEALAEARARLKNTGRHWWAAEIHRIHGELLLLQSPHAHEQAQRCLERALEIAREQGAKSLELRGATSLARLWLHQGRGEDALDLLAPIYGWFTEGFDTLDLEEARALLETLTEQVRGCKAMRS